MANITVGVTATLVDQITGLGSSTVYNAFRFELNTSTGTIGTGTYDIAVSFADTTTTTNYIFQSDVSVGASFGTLVPFTLPGTYYSIGAAASVSGTAATIFNFSLY